MVIEKPPRIIFLSGFMGSGKSTIGRNLAKELNLAFEDLDKKIEEETGKIIPRIFKDSGESAFRKIEQQTLRKIIRIFEGVLALGGGSLQNQSTVDHLKQNGLLVFIDTPISVILDRISEDKNRPLLLDKDGKLKTRERLKNELLSLYEKRLLFYEQADIKVVNEGEQTADELGKQLLKKIRNHGY